MSDTATMPTRQTIVKLATITFVLIITDLLFDIVVVVVIVIETVRYLDNVVDYDNDNRLADHDYETMSDHGYPREPETYYEPSSRPNQGAPTTYGLLRM